MSISKDLLVYVGGRLHSRIWTGQDGVGPSALQFLTPKPYKAPAAEAV